MTFVGLVVPGEFIDAYLYGEHLYVFDRQGRMLAVSAWMLADAIAAEANLSAQAARALFVDQKQVSSHGAPADPRVVEEVQHLIGPGGESAYVYVDLARLDPRYTGFAADSFVMDLLVTYWCAFVATEDALVSVPIAGGEVDGPDKVRLREPCRMASSRWGAVTVSCLGQGTWSLLGESSLVEGRTKRTEQVSTEYSERHAWAGHSLFTYGSETEYDVFRGSIPRGKGKKQLLEGFDQVHPDLASEVFGIDPDSSDRRFVATLGTTMFTVDRGDCLVTSLTSWGGEVHSGGGARFLGRIEGRPESVVETDGGYVVETRSSLTYVAANGSSVVLDAETISLRSYPQSRRFRRAITATTDEGLLVGVALGDHPYPRMERYG